MYERKTHWARKSKRTISSLLACAMLFCWTSQQGWAWGREGHRLTALVADRYLTPEAKAKVAELLHNGSLEDIAPWADTYRSDHPETGKWHYVDIPKAETKFDRMRDCPAATDPESPWRDCVTDRILYFEGRLGDGALSESDRAMALKFLVHLIGDIHQPFHAFGDERGGNSIEVNFMGSSVCGAHHCNLHGVWDDILIEEQGLSEKKYTERLLEEIKANQWERQSGGAPATWANISHHYALEALVPSGALITHEYMTEEAKVVDAQLALGGLRLAHVLNHIFAAADAAAQPPVIPGPAGAVTAPSSPGAPK